MYVSMYPWLRKGIMMRASDPCNRVIHVLFVELSSSWLAINMPLVQTNAVI